MDRELIAKIADEIVRRLSEPPAEEKVSEALVVVCDYVVRGADAKVQLWERFGGRVSLGALRDGYGTPGFDVTQMNEQEMLTTASQSDNIIFLSPKVSMLQNIARGLEGEYIENLFFRSLLWGKKVHIMLDYSPPPKFKRGTFYQAIAESLDTLVEMGIAVFTYESEHVTQEGLSLVTENEVTDAYKRMNTKIVCQKGAIVTPAARDKARELNIKIEWQGK